MTAKEKNRYALIIPIGIPEKFQIREPMPAFTVERSIMRSHLLQIRKPTLAEKAGGAEIVFIRADFHKTYAIKACTCYESYEQWGAPVEILRDNVSLVQHWRNNKNNDPAYTHGFQRKEES
jgi:hypothetical protein